MRITDWSSDVCSSDLMSDLASLAEILDRAAHERVATPQLTHARPELTVEDAYEIQRLSIDRRLQRGERRVGVKLGLTSRAKMQQVGVDQMACGRLTDTMLIEEGASLALSHFVHPRTEPEPPFLLSPPP